MEASAENHQRRRFRGARNGALPQMDIPAFGDWEFLHHDRVPITQYFDFYSARSHQQQQHSPYPVYYTPADALFPHYDDFHGLQQYHFPFPTPVIEPVTNWERGGGRQVKEECGTRRRRKQPQQRRSCLENKNRVFDFDTTATLTETFTITTPPSSATHGVVTGIPSADVDKSKSKSKNNVKAKDEDLYKIPPELLRNSKPKKRMSKFLTKCFVTVCASY